MDKDTADALRNAIKIERSNLIKAEKVTESNQLADLRGLFNRWFDNDQKNEDLTPELRQYIENFENKKKTDVKPAQTQPKLATTPPIHTINAKQSKTLVGLTSELKEALSQKAAPNFLLKLYNEAQELINAGQSSSSLVSLAQDAFDLHEDLLQQYVEISKAANSGYFKDALERIDRMIANGIDFFISDGSDERPIYEVRREYATQYEQFCDTKLKEFISRAAQNIATYPKKSVTQLENALKNLDGASETVREQAEAKLDEARNSVVNWNKADKIIQEVSEQQLPINEKLQRLRVARNLFSTHPDLGDLLGQAEQDAASHYVKPLEEQPNNSMKVLDQQLNSAKVVGTNDQVQILLLLAKAQQAVIENQPDLGLNYLVQAQQLLMDQRGSIPNNEVNSPTFSAETQKQFVQLRDRGFEALAEGRYKVALNYFQQVRDLGLQTEEIKMVIAKVQSDIEES